MSWLLQRVGLLAPAEPPAPPQNLGELLPDQLTEISAVINQEPSITQDKLDAREDISREDHVSISLHGEDNASVLCTLPSEICPQNEIVNRRFSYFENGLAEYIQSIALSQGFTCSRSSHKMDPTRARALFDQDDIVQRGFFYCTSKSLGVDKCGFKVPFTFDFVSREYVIKSKGLDLRHNHVTTPLVVDGVIYKRKSSELTVEEKTTILEVAPFVGIGALRRILRNSWPNVGYDSDLLYRWTAKAKGNTFGVDKDAVNSFMAQGQTILSEKGIFEVRYNEGMKIEEVFIQTRSMAAYADKYVDFTILDGTFSVSMYDLVLLVFSNVDCLMKSVISGIVLAPSERSDTVIRAARQFSLASEQTVLMTDQASAFALAASGMNKVHLLCLHHFRTAMFSSHSGMCQDRRTAFMRSCNNLIFEVQEISQFINLFEQTQNTFRQFPGARKFLKSLWDNRESVCATFTAAHFTAGHVSSQRAESLNSTIKEHGSLKKELAKYNLNQLLEHLLSIMRQQDSKAKVEIISCIKAGQGWSKQVDTIWKNENSVSNEYHCVCTDPSNRVWSVERHDGQGTAHIASLPSIGHSFPSCDCRNFTSRLIPCRHICAVYSRVEDKLFSKSSLHPRWWIANHPKYQECMAHLGLDNAISGQNKDLNSPAADMDLHVQLFDQIRVPNTQQSRFRRLDEQAKELVSAGSSADDFTYKFVMKGLVSLMNAAKSLQDGQSVETFGVRAPIEASNRRDISSNISRCVRNSGPKKRKLAACRTCSSAGRTDAVGHRANSSKCPLLQSDHQKDTNENSQE